MFCFQAEGDKTRRQNQKNQRLNNSREEFGIERKSNKKEHLELQERNTTAMERFLI